MERQNVTLNHLVYRPLKTSAGTYHIYSLSALEEQGIAKISHLPFSIKILLESSLRNLGKYGIEEQDVLHLARWSGASEQREIPFMPSRVIMQDASGIPALVDLVTLRGVFAEQGMDKQEVNPVIPVDLVIDHSIQVDHFGSLSAKQQNLEEEYKRNQERYEFLKWAQKKLKGFRVIPPANGIIHQVNLEYLAHVVQTGEQNGQPLLFPDTVIGTDSHTTMINGLGILGWGVGGIEAEAVLLGNPINMLIPEVVGVRITGTLHEGVTATDLALRITELLREQNVVGKFVEFYGPALKQLSLPDRATIANMAPEYGASMGLFPVDEETLKYLRLTGRNEQVVNSIEAYAKEQGLFYTDQVERRYSQVVELDLSTIEASVAGPTRPHDRVPLSQLQSSFQSLVKSNEQELHKITTNNQTYYLKDGSIVIAAITSCTNTSNPVNMIAAGLLAKKAVEHGLRVPEYIQTSLAPGSKVVSAYLEQAGLTPYLEKLGFYHVGYGCAVCVGNTGKLPEQVEQLIETSDVMLTSVLSGNRNFEGRIHSGIKANYLASPPLVIAFALAGRIDINLEKEPIAVNQAGEPVYLRDLWPTRKEIEEIERLITPELFQGAYASVFEGDTLWKGLPSQQGDLFQWDKQSTYFKPAPFFDNAGLNEDNKGIKEARALLVLGDFITTDHISPVGAIPEDSPAGLYLMEQGVQPADFNSYGSRRGNHEVLVRGTFAHPRLNNRLVARHGGFTKHVPSQEIMSLYEAAMRYKEEHTPLIILAGKGYGAGSARDWAAKGTYLLGVKAVIAESFERIHRSNLAMMGILPLQFRVGESYSSLGLTGEECYTILGLDQPLQPGQMLSVEVSKENQILQEFKVTLRLDTYIEIDYFRQGGIFKKVLRKSGR